MTTPAAPPPPPEEDRPTEAVVIAAFVAAALAALAAPSPTSSWALALDATLLPLLDRAHGGPSAVERQSYLGQVRPHLLGIDLYQPARAARTEYRAAVAAGRLSRAAARARRAGVRLTKTWVTEHDERVRPSHVALDGVTLEADEMFDVGGFPAPVPGWWTLPPEERAACRCHLTFETAALTAAGGPMNVIAAGVALVARDTGRVLMLQRRLDDTDGGTWEFPGGRLDEGEAAVAAALREFGEETGVDLAELPHDELASWTSPDGVYRAYAVTVDTEAQVNAALDGVDAASEAAGARQALAWWGVNDAMILSTLRPAVGEHTPWALLHVDPTDPLAADCGCDEPADDELSQDHLLDLLSAYSPEDFDAWDDDEVLVAEGGADRNRGGAEKLRRYWTTGPGGQRIGWGSPGDFTRCVDELSEHLGLRAKGYCALRHKERNGFYPGDKRNLTSTAEVTEREPEPLTAAGTAYPGEHVYASELFEDPRLTEPTPLTVDGTRVYGHVADWSTCHVGYSKQCRTAPRSRSGYARFHVGEVMTASGPLAVGNLVLATGHAGLGLNLSAAADHYARSGSAVAVVRAGEDRHGIWVAGSIIEGTPPAMVAALRRCPLSGDWRDDRGSSEMVAALAVNVPGFPLVRERREGSRTYALVSAGVVMTPEMERVDALAQRLLVDDLATRVIGAS